MLPLDNANLKDIDFDFELPLSSAAHRMAEAKDILTLFEIPWRMSGRSWLRITMPPGSLDLYLCPGNVPAISLSNAALVARGGI